jgi:hypothetical protein
MFDNKAPPADYAIGAGAKVTTHHGSGDRRLSDEVCKAVDLQAADKFLRLLDPAAIKHTFQCFSDRGEDRSLAHIIHGSLDLCADRLIELNDAGAGIFITVNRTDGRGRKADNIVGIRAVFIDLDGAPLEPVYQHLINPQIVVETSPGKFHAYWLVENVPLEHFTDIQTALAERFHADPAVKDLPRVLRLPGFMHRKRDPFMVRIIESNDLPRYGCDQFEYTPSEPHISHDQEPITDREILLAMATLQVIRPEQEWRDRNLIGMATHRACGGHQAAFDAWCKWLQRSGRFDFKSAERSWAGFGKYLGNTHAKPVGLGTLIFKADEADRGWRHRPIFDLLNGEAV